MTEAKLGNSNGEVTGDAVPMGKTSIKDKYQYKYRIETAKTPSIRSTTVQCRSLHTDVCNNIKGHDLINQ